MIISNNRIEELKYSIIKEMHMLENDNKDLFSINNPYLDFKIKMDNKLINHNYITDELITYSKELSETLYIYITSYNEYIKYSKSLAFFLYTEHKLLKKYQSLYKLMKNKKDINVKLIDEIEYLNNRLKNNKVVDDGFEKQEIGN